jgi:hypothetical protein
MYTTGIKVSQFMEALDPHGRDFEEPWKVLAEGMMPGIRKHWTAFTYARQRQQVWTCPGYPKAYVFLEHTQNNIHPLAEEAFSCPEKIFYDDWE